MTKLLNQAMAIVSTLSEEGQDTLARHIMDEAKRIADAAEKLIPA